MLILLSVDIVVHIEREISTRNVLDIGQKTHLLLCLHFVAWWTRILLLSLISAAHFALFTNRNPLFFSLRSIWTTS